MTRFFTFSILPRLGRMAGVMACCLGAVSLIGASKASVGRPVKTVVSHPAASVPAWASRELMHDVAPAEKGREKATLASAVLHGNIGPKRHVVMMLVTAYCPCPRCCGSHARGLTASGLPVSYNGGRFVAADTRLFHFGTHLRVPGYAGGQAVDVIDRGGAIKGTHIDVFFPTHEEAREWGRKWVAVTVEE